MSQAGGLTSGKLVLISTQTASNSASLNFTNLSTFRSCIILLNNVVPSTAGQAIKIRVSSDNGSSYFASGYLAGINYSTYNSSTLTNVTSTSGFILAADVGSIGSSGSFTLSNLNLATSVTIAGSSSWRGNGTPTYLFGYSGGDSGNQNINAVQIICDSGNIQSGSATMYGYLRS